MSSDEIAVLLARLDERFAGLQKQVESFQAVHAAEVSHIKIEYVRLERFLHVERIVFGIGAAIGLAVLGIILPKVLS